MTGIEEAAEMARIRNALIAVTDAHEATCPGNGVPCLRNRRAAIAFLAHALGIRGQNAWNEVVAMTSEYDARCQGRDYRHEHN